MANLGAVLTALASRISTGMAGTAIGGRVYPYPIDAPNPPCAVVLPSPELFIAYDRTMGADASTSDDFSLLVRVFMGTADDRTGTAELVSYFDKTGSTSLRTVIYGDRTLGGVVSWTDVTGGSSFGDVEWAGTIFFGADLHVDCGT